MLRVSLSPNSIGCAPRCRAFATASSKPIYTPKPPSSPPHTHYRITLLRSAIGLPPKFRLTLEALGLKRRMQSVYHPFSPECAGQILRVKELVKVENVASEDVKTEAQERAERRPEKGFVVLGKQPSPWAVLDADIPEEPLAPKAGKRGKKGKAVEAAEAADTVKVEEDVDIPVPPSQPSAPPGARSFHSSSRTHNTNFDASSLNLTGPLTLHDTPNAIFFLSAFRVDKIPRSSCHVQFSRSSGPGGQNVNKLNTKATIRFPLTPPHPPFFPVWCLESLRTSKEYVPSSDSILVTSSSTRSQAQNVEDCFRKLHALIHSHALALIPALPNEEKQKRVEKLEVKEKAVMRKEKHARKGIKSARKVDKGDW